MCHPGVPSPHGLFHLCSVLVVGRQSEKSTWFLFFGDISSGRRASSSRDWRGRIPETGGPSPPKRNPPTAPLGSPFLLGPRGLLVIPRGGLWGRSMRVFLGIPNASPCAGSSL